MAEMRASAAKTADIARRDIPRCAISKQSHPAETNAAVKTKRIMVDFFIIIG